MRIEPEISGVSVVLRGDFNPAIFTPAWFALHDLLPRSASDNAELQVAHPQVTAFSTEWLQLEVTTERFTVISQHAPFVRVRDLALRVFREHLHHTPLRALGINRDAHFRLRNRETRDRIGRRLAPVEPWGQWIEELGLDGEYGGMKSLTMTSGRPEGRPPGGEVNVKVEPSLQIDDRRLGVYVSVNDHYVIGSADAEGRAQLMEFLETQFDTSVRRSEDIIHHIMSLAAPDREGGAS